MKTRIILLILALAFACPALAQQDDTLYHKNEFTVGYGLIPATSYPLLFMSTNDHFIMHHDRIGALNTSYTRRVSKRIGLGLTICYDPVRITYYDMSGTERIPVCKVKEDCVTVMGHIKFYWLKDKNVFYYSKLAGILGLCFLNYRQEEYHPEIYEVQPITEPLAPGLQFTFFGMDFLMDYCTGFLQFGIGNEGLVSIGLRYEL